MTQRLFTWLSEKWRSNFVRHEILFHPAVTVVFKPPFSASDNDKEDSESKRQHAEEFAETGLRFSVLQLALFR